MKNEKEVLCEIIFKDHKLEVISTRIGTIDDTQLITLSTNSNDFLIFKEKYNSPILKSDIIEIIIHRDDRKISVNEVNSRIIKHIKSQDKGKIS
ncbi:MAG: hypothetical protein KAW51_08635 [Candidatus Lokiarchaeota archaeon]|nr:hypothetical protein [Candidatus Lokiarchaeota archaeon]